MKREWEEFRIAGAFLTVFPLARNLEMEPERLARSMGFFPAVGLAMGLGLVVLDWFLAPLIPRAVLDCLLILMLIAATGALPLDGIANLIDGLTGGKDPKEVLRIMKDSRVGAMGVAGLVMVLLLKYLSLYNIPLPMKSNALIFMPASGLWVQVALAFCCRCVPTEGETGGDFVNNVGQRELLIATATLLLAGLVLFGWKGLVFLLLLGLAATVLMRYFEIRLGGVTGDVLGGAAEIVEILTLLLVLALY